MPDRCRRRPGIAPHRLTDTTLKALPAPAKLGRLRNPAVQAPGAWLWHRDEAAPRKLTCRDLVHRLKDLSTRFRWFQLPAASLAKRHNELSRCKFLPSATSDSHLCDCTKQKLVSRRSVCFIDCCKNIFLRPRNNSIPGIWPILAIRRLRATRVPALPPG